MSQDYCTDHSLWEIEDGYMCAGLAPNDSTPMKGWKHVTAGDKGTCQGDFGAPLICDIDGTATFVGINSNGDLTECGLPGKPAIHLSVNELIDWIPHIINQHSPPKTCFEFHTDPSITDSLGEEIKLFKNGDEVGAALGSYQQSNTVCIEETSDGDVFEFRNGGKDNVYIKEIFINGVRKNFVPFWIDSNVDIENDPYTSDCSDQTNASNPHAYTQFTITNGEISSQNCIEKPPVYSTWGSYSQCSTTCGNGEKTKNRTCIGGICSLATLSNLIQIDICNERECIQLSSWGEWSICDWSANDYSTGDTTCEMKRSRSCLTGCEFLTDDLTQTQACNDQQCPEKAVLLLRGTNPENKPMVISFDGEVDDDIEFEYSDDYNNGYGGCPATINGEFFMFGGHITKTKFSKINNCAMEVIGDMGFGQYYGACNTFVSNNEEFVLLCFTRDLSNPSNPAKKACYRFDGTIFTPSESTTYFHEEIVSLGNYRGQPFTTGGSGPGRTDTEILTIATDTWHSGTRYPYSDKIFYYSTASIGGKVYLFGGSPDENRISEYNDDQWSDYGSLLTGRHTLGSISFNSKTMILGLNSNILPTDDLLKTEVWDFKTGVRNQINHSLKNLDYRPGTGIYLVDINFCRKNK